MKKIFSVLMLAMFAIIIVGCGQTTAEETTAAPTTDAPTTDAPTTAAPTTTEAPYVPLVLKGPFTYDATETPDVSLANTHQNGVVVDGKYTVAGITFDVVDTYKTTYNTEPANAFFNYLTNSWKYNSDQYGQMVEGLIGNDMYSNLVGDMATDYSVVDNTDGSQTWYFKIRENVPWVVNSTGAIYQVDGVNQYVTAQDFVDGVKYVLDPINGSATQGIIDGLILGAHEYYSNLMHLEGAERTALIAQFTDVVGVKAVSTNVVAYTLIDPTPYFLSSLTYSPFLPVNQDFLEEQGSDFGISENNILVNGAFTMTEHTASTKIVLTKNALYWDIEHVYVNTVESRFVPGTATASTLRQWYENGDIDAFRVTSQDSVGYETYVTGTEGTGTVTAPANPITQSILQNGGATYIGYFNFVRSTFEYTTATAKTDDQIAATAAALANKNFRLGFLYGLNVMRQLQWYNHAQPEQWLMRAYTIRELCSFNGKDYADYVDDVFNAEQGTTGVTLTGILQGSDPIYDEATAQDYFDDAYTELIAGGLTAADFPIQIDVIGSMNLERQPYEQAMYNSLSIASNGTLIVGYNVPKTDDQDADWGSVTQNYDFSLWSGWGPDYADPKTFLHTMIIGGDMVDMMGFTVGAHTPTALETEILGEFTAAYDIAAAITDVALTEDRYEAFAEAEYKLIYEDAVVIPWLSQNGYSPVVSNTIPFSAAKVSYGLSGDRFKNIIVSSSPITQTQRAALEANYDANR